MILIRIHPKFRSGGILENLVFRSGQTCQEVLYQEIYRNDPETPALNLEPAGMIQFIDPENKWSSG